MRWQRVVVQDSLKAPISYLKESSNQYKDCNRGCTAHTPAIPDLRDKDRPKDEDHFSNYIKRHLSDDLNRQGIISNREVQIRRGEFTDIRVDAVRKVSHNDPLDLVTVIVEAKGCWNKGVKTDMAVQLRNRS